MKEMAMDYRLKVFNGFICTALLALLSFQAPLFAKSTAGSHDRHDRQRYIVILKDAPLTSHDGRSIQAPERSSGSVQLKATANKYTGARKLDVNSADSRRYLKFLDERFKTFRGEALLRLGRQLKPVHRYRHAINGFATDLTAAEVKALREVSGVVAIVPDEIQRLETDSGPDWIGADLIHNGSAGVEASGGEGVVVGVIDSGVNWDHPSFADPGEGGGSGWDHENPYGMQLGLCSESEVLCNDKLVGVYDFVEDDPFTEAIEENTNGKDNDGHGSHVASTAIGNPVSVAYNGILMNLAGVAPNANIVSYRVCYIGDPATGEDDGCATSAILDAIDQAVNDGVDVINYSLGQPEVYDPWIPWSTTYAFLNLRSAGIFVATSAGNYGPNPGTIGAPANAPWITAVGNATHDRVFANALENLSGGATFPPNNLVGKSFTNGTDIKDIVHAKDFGYPLCGTGDPQSGSDCANNTGVSNPFPPGTFNGEIVVCDRGTYGRIEKGKNLQLAGAGGYILANTERFGEETEATNHCLPAIHLGEDNSNELRTWLDGGFNHRASISDFGVFHVEEAGDSIYYNSSRGPNPPPAQDVMKPDVIAPGTNILAAWSVGNNYNMISGTSMAAPHVAGGAALLKSVHSDWTPSMLTSALTLTATPELALDFHGTEATMFDRGAGRPRLDQAVNTGLYLDETVDGFLAADPSQGGDPRTLNLPGLIDTVCVNSCDIQRTVTDLAGGASWSASGSVNADGVSVSISPSNFTLANGASRQLTVRVDLTGAELTGNWVYGEVRLTSSGHPGAVFPLAVYAHGGVLPDEWEISIDQVSGWQDFELSGLVPMPDATYTSGGLVVPTETTESLPQHPNPDYPYDSQEGVMTVWHTVPPNTLLLHTETLESESVGLDLDLYVGLDVNNDGQVQESEQLCASISETEVELCQIHLPVAGRYWSIVQNYTAVMDPDDATLRSAVVGEVTPSPLSANGTGIVQLGETAPVRVSWDDVGAVPGTQLMGAVGIGTHRENPINIGVIPVIFTKTAVATPETLVLMDGINRGLTLSGGGMHDRVFVDIPSGTDSFTIAASASGEDSGQNEALSIELYRLDFDDAFADAPFAKVPDTSGSPLASASGANGNGPTLTVSGSDAVPGRWYAVLKNSSGSDANVNVKADLVFSGSPIDVQFGLWEPSSRSDTHQGIDFNTTGDYRAFLWYTYDEDGKPAWYQAAAIATDGNVFVAGLYRYTNDGLLQQSSPVGHVSVTVLGERDSIFSWVLFGKNGSDRMFALTSLNCPTIDGSKKSYDGLWSRTAIGVGGASGLVNTAAQAFVHYIYDDKGNPVWLTAAPEVQSPTAEEMRILQWSGYCAVCSGDEPTFETVGVFSRIFSDEYNLNWTLDYVLKSPLSGSIERTDDTGKLTVTQVCN